jgi:hypothetical protein
MFVDAESFEYHFTIDTTTMDQAEIPQLLRRAGQFLSENALVTRRWLETTKGDGPRVVIQGTVSGAHVESGDSPAGSD